MVKIICIVGQIHEFDLQHEFDQRLTKNTQNHELL